MNPQVSNALLAVFDQIVGSVETGKGNKDEKYPPVISSQQDPSKYASANASNRPINPGICDYLGSFIAGHDFGNIGCSEGKSNPHPYTIKKPHC